jgi:predicted transcriptional regulator
MSVLDRTPTLTGAEVRRRRQALGITQQRLAAGAEVTQTYVCNVENNWEPRSDRPRHALRRIAAELDRLERRAAREATGQNGSTDTT